MLPDACGKCGSKALSYEAVLGELSCLHCGWRYYVELPEPARIRRWLRFAKEKKLQ